ncbi:MAG: (2Fe-2S)-binding protein [Anaerolineaceae bacterium]|nr:(2Fe-2S)-binding protein [Anaerolineaceae bacterium]
MQTISITIIVNGKAISLRCAANQTLLDVLRDELGLTGAKDGCGGEGECGACTVIMNGKAVNSCMVFAGQADGANIETIEGLARGEELHPLQKAFIDAGAIQCGFCTPGAIMSAKALLDQNTSPTEEEIKEALSGNLCRCTGYKKMIEAIKIAARGGSANDR